MRRAKAGRRLAKCTAEAGARLTRGARTRGVLRSNWMQREATGWVRFSWRAS